MWAVILQESLGPKIALHDQIIVQEYEAILQDLLLHVVEAVFPHIVSIFQDDNAPCVHC